MTTACRASAAAAARGWPSPTSSPPVPTWCRCGPSARPSTGSAPSSTAPTGGAAAPPCRPRSCPAPWRCCARRSPTWTPDQVKHALKGTARPVALDDPYAVGRGLPEVVAATIGRPDRRRAAAVDARRAGHARRQPRRARGRRRSAARAAPWSSLLTVVTQPTCAARARWSARPRRSGRRSTATTGPATTGPRRPGTPASGPATTGPATTGPATTGPATTGPATTGPATTGPATTGPATTGPAATDRHAAGVGRRPSVRLRRPGDDSLVPGSLLYGSAELT